MNHRFDQMMAREYNEELKKNPVVYVPFGAFEMHGKHSVFGLDGIKAHELCLRAAEITGGVVLPPTHWGCEEPISRDKDGKKIAIKKMPGDILISQNLFKNLAAEIYDALAKEGFKIIVALTGHYPEIQVKILKELAKQKSRQHKIIIWAFSEPELTKPFGYIGDHAGRDETSILWALKSELVDISRLKGKDALATIWSDKEEYRDPRKCASPEIGQKIVELIIEKIVTKITELRK